MKGINIPPFLDFIEFCMFFTLPPPILPTPTVLQFSPHCVPCHLPCQGPFVLSKHFLMCGLPLEDLPGPILLAKVHFSPPVLKTCQQLLSLGWRFMPNSLLHSKNFAGLGLHRSCVRCNNHCASICGLVLLCAQDIVSF